MTTSPKTKRHAADSPIKKAGSATPRSAKAEAMFAGVAAPKSKRRKTQVKPGQIEADGPSKVTTIRIPPSLKIGINMLERAVGFRRPLNKWITIALADYIDRRTAAAENELELALKNVRAYRKTDPSYKRAIKAFIDAEVEFAGEDPMEGSTSPTEVGPAVSMVRELIRG